MTLAMKMILVVVFLVSSPWNIGEQIVSVSAIEESSWDQWWTYDGISGVEFWGLLNPKWSHCNKGRRQSPVDINPDLLLFDPSLNGLNVIGDHVKGQMINTGRGIKFIITGNLSVAIKGGPLSYEYSLSHIHFHYGREDDRGSEHTISGIRFPGELQIYFFNSQLYHNWTEAHDQPNGLAAISILIQKRSNLNPNPKSKPINPNSNPNPSPKSTLDLSPNSQLTSLFTLIGAVRYKGLSSKVHSLKFLQLINPLSMLNTYVTYEGSITEPSCDETVTWILVNKPIYVSQGDLINLRSQIHLEGSAGDHFRSPQHLNSRTLRTNIVLNSSSRTSSSSNSGSKSSNSGSRTSNSSSRTSSEHDQEMNRMKFCSGTGYITYKANIAKGGNLELAEDSSLYN